MNVIDMAVQILLVSNAVLPETALPDIGFTPLLARCAARLASTDLGKITFGEESFDLFPSYGIF